LEFHLASLFLRQATCSTSNEALHALLLPPSPPQHPVAKHTQPKRRGSQADSILRPHNESNPFRARFTRTPSSSSASTEELRHSPPNLNNGQLPERLRERRPVGGCLLPTVGDETIVRLGLYEGRAPPSGARSRRPNRPITEGSVPLRSRPVVGHSLDLPAEPHRQSSHLERLNPLRMPRAWPIASSLRKPVAQRGTPLRWTFVSRPDAEHFRNR
jgi:hypothetical protein